MAGDRERGGNSWLWLVAGGAALLVGVAVFCGGVLVYGVRQFRELAVPSSLVVAPPAPTVAAPTTAATSATAAKPELPWMDLPGVAKVGDVTVWATPFLDKARLSVLGLEANQSDETYFGVLLTIANDNPKRRIEYRAWSGLGHSILGRRERPEYRLWDDLNNEYRMAEFSPASVVVGQVTGTANLYAEKPLADVLYFDRPVRAAGWLYLELPASHVGETGSFRFRVHTSKLTDMKRAVENTQKGKR